MRLYLSFIGLVVFICFVGIAGPILSDSNRVYAKTSDYRQGSYSSGRNTQLEIKSKRKTVTEPFDLVYKLSYMIEDSLKE